MSTPVPLCKTCKQPLRPERLFDKRRLCQACQDVVVEKLLFPPFDNRTDLAAATQIP